MATSFLKVGNNKFNIAHVKSVMCYNTDALHKGAHCDVTIRGAYSDIVINGDIIGNSGPLYNPNAGDQKYAFNAPSNEYNDCVDFVSQ